MTVNPPGQPGGNGQQPAMPPFGRYVAPVQCATTLQLIKTPVGNRVLLLVESANGAHAYFLDAAHAYSLADQLTNVAAMARTGIIVPSAWQMPGHHDHGSEAP